MWGGMGLSLGLTFTIGMAFAAPAILAFASVLKPVNKGLQQASMITGRIYESALFVAGLIAIGAGINEFAEDLLATSGDEAVSAGEKAAAASEEIKAGILPTYEEAVEGNSPVYRNVLYSGGEKQEESGYENEALVGGGNDAADTDVGDEGSEETGAAGNAGAAVQRAVVGCSRTGFLPCDHSRVITFSCSEVLQPDYLIPVPLGDIINRLDVNVYDEILQEFSNSDYLRLVHASYIPTISIWIS